MKDCKLFVAKLPCVVGESEIAKFFAAWGTVRSVKLARDPDTDASKCYGWVEFETIVDAAKAVAEANGAQFYGRKLVVAFAHARVPRFAGVTR